MQESENGRRVITPEEISVFCEQIALILSAGIPLYEGVEALCSDLTQTRFKKEFEQISRDVGETGSLAQALEKSGIFPVYMVEMTRIGESTGRLEQVMNALQTHYEREARIRAAIRSAVAYPALLMILMAGVIAVLILKVLPVFQRTMGALEMSASANATMSFGVNLGRATLIIVAVLVLAGVVLMVLMKTKLKDRVSGTLMRVIPALGKVADRMAASRFASVMSMMLSSGFPMEEALEMAPRVLNTGRAKERVEETVHRVQEGMPFADAVEKSGLFAPLHVRMIRTGERAGQMDRVMDKVASIYEQEVDDRLGHLISIIEPTLAIVLSIVIGAILLSVMLPMASMISSMM